MNQRINEKGLTLIEVMISMLLAGVLSTGLFYMVAGQSRTYEQQSTLLNAQENLWGAMEFLQSQVRLAGYGFGQCKNSWVDDNSPYVEPAGIPPGITQFMPWLPPGGDEWYPFLQPIRLHNGCNIMSENNFIECNAHMNYEVTDSISFGHIDPAETRLLGVTGQTKQLVHGRLAEPFTSGTPYIRMATKAMFQPNDFVTLWEAAFPNRSCTLYQIDSAGVTWNSGQNAWDANLVGQVGGFTAWPYGGGIAKLLSERASHSLGADPSFGQGSIVINLGSNPRMRHVSVLNTDNLPTTLGILKGAEYPKLVTWRTNYLIPGIPGWSQSLGVTMALPLDQLRFEVVAEGIEDMQIAAACDLNGDGVLNEGQTVAQKQNDEWFFNAPPAGGTGDYINCADKPIKAVRITLTSRSAREDPAFSTGKLLAAEDRPDATTTDGFRRRVLTSTMVPRNLVR